MPPLLSQDEIASRLTDLPNWSPAGDYISREFSFPTFKEAISFINRVADVAEEIDHHPDIAINYTRVNLSITTYSEGGLTRRDFTLARKINDLEPA